MVLAPIVRGRKGEYGKQLEELRGEGFSRAKVDGELRRLDEEIVLDKKYKHDIAVVVDRLVMKGELRKRLADSIETAVALADGLVEIELVDADPPRPRLQTYSGEVRLPRARAEPGRARAADLQLQLAARRLPAVHRPRIADGDRSRARRARSDAVDRRGGDRAVGGERLGVLRPADPGDRRALRGRPRDAVGRSCPSRRATSSCTGPKATGSRSPTATGSAAGARTRRTFEGIVPNLERRYRETESEFSREKIEEYMTLRPCPECKGARLRPESRAVLVAGTADPRVRRAVGPAGARMGRAGSSSPSTTGGSPGWSCGRSRSGCSSSRTSASATCRWSGRPRRCPAARPSGSGWPRRSGPRSSACSTSSTSRRSGCTSATTRS